VTLADLRTLFYVYIGTTSSDPMYPTATVNALINAVAGKYRQETYQADPSRFELETTLTPTGQTRSYPLPADFGGFLDVRFDSNKGVKLDQVRSDELNAAWAFAAFAITGPDASATLSTSDFCTLGEAIYLKYLQVQPGMSADTDEPLWLDADFHDLLAREAAIDAYGLGDEAQPSDRFMQETGDRRAMWYLHLMRRGVNSLKTRGGA
jgi:hypothetical protein